VSRARKRRPRPTVRLRLTAAGWLILVAAAMVGAAAFKSQAPMLYVLFGGMAGALAVSMVLSWTMVSAVRLHRDVPSRLWQNQTVHLGYHLRNGRRRGACLALKVEEVTPRGLQSAAGFCVHLPARSAFRAAGRFVASRRGRIVLPGVRMWTSFPFGMFVAGARMPLERSVIVWPAKGRLRRSLLQHGAMEASRAAPSNVKGGQDEFFGLRDYRVGDDPRWIHWRRSAGRSSPVVREMTRTRPEVLWIVLDACVGEDGNGEARALEAMLRFAATLIDHALARGYQVGLILSGADGSIVHSPGSGRGRRCAMLDALACVEADRSGPPGGASGHFADGRFRGARVVVLTPRRDRALAAAPPAGTRQFTVVTADTLGRYFVDAPLAAEAD
jgi:uncharacterized protein (DUF58 family)